MVEFKMDDIDVFGQEIGFVVIEIQVLQVVEVFVEVQSGNFWLFCFEGVMLFGQCLCIVCVKNVFGMDGQFLFGGCSVESSV